MKVEEIQKKEGQNTGSIFLRKEGLFWRAYEQSAFHFVKHIRDYVPQKKYFKNIKSEIVFIGFPGTKIDEILAIALEKGFSVIEKEENNIQLSGFKGVERFKEWKGNMLSKTNEESMEDCNYMQIIEKIKSYPVINRTAFETQQFLMELQNQINGHIRSSACI
jgi:hypothetical protein